LSARLFFDVLCGLFLGGLLLVSVFISLSLPLMAIFLMRLAPISGFISGFGSFLIAL